MLMKRWSRLPLWIFQYPAACRETVDACGASWQLWSGTEGLLERGKDTEGQCPPARSPGDCPVCLHCLENLSLSPLLTWKCSFPVQTC